MAYNFWTLLPAEYAAFHITFSLQMLLHIYISPTMQIKSLYKCLFGHVQEVSRTLQSLLSLKMNFHIYKLKCCGFLTLKSLNVTKVRTNT